MFSVIIPVFNKAAYVEKAIWSVLNQTFQSYELIVINDGSTDNSLGIIKQICDSIELKFKIIDQSNQGVSSTRNLGAKIAVNDYVAFLDADDWWSSVFLERMSQLINSYPQAGIYGSGYYKVKNGKNIPAQIGVHHEFKQGEINYFEAYIRSPYMPLWTGATIVRKLIFDLESGFKSNLKMGEDFDLWVRIAIHNPVVFLNIPLSYYNQDVELVNRAVGSRLYLPEEYMLFNDYSTLLPHKQFSHLLERLQLYSLLPYYIVSYNKHEVNQILNKIHWKEHSIKFYLSYKVFPRFIVRYWYVTLNSLSIFIKYISRNNKIASS